MSSCNVDEPVGARVGLRLRVRVRVRVRVRDRLRLRLRLRVRVTNPSPKPSTRRRKAASMDPRCTSSCTAERHTESTCSGRAGV